MHISLICFHLGGSATGECRREKGQHNGAFADEIGKMNGAALAGRQRKIRSFVADFERRRGRRSLRGEQGRTESKAAEKSHGGSEDATAAFEVTYVYSNE